MRDLSFRKIKRAFSLVVCLFSVINLGTGEVRPGIIIVNGQPPGQFKISKEAMSQIYERAEEELHINNIPDRGSLFLFCLSDYIQELIGPFCSMPVETKVFTEFIVDHQTLVIDQSDETRGVIEERRDQKYKEERRDEKYKEERGDQKYKEERRDQEYKIDRESSSYLQTSEYRRSTTDEELKRLNARSTKQSLTSEQEQMRITIHNELLQLIDELDIQGVSIDRFSLMTIAQWLIESGFNLDITFHQFLEILISEGLITHEEYQSIVEYLESRSISLDEKALAVIEKLESLGYTVNLQLKGVLTFLSKYHLITDENFQILREVMDSLELYSDVLIKALDKLSESLSLETSIQTQEVSSKEDNLSLITEASTLQPEIEVILKVDHHSAYPGQNLTYTIQLANRGSIEASEIFLFNVLPENTELVDDSIVSTRYFKKPIKLMDGNKTCLFWHIPKKLYPRHDGKFDIAISFQVKIIMRESATDLPDASHVHLLRSFHTGKIK